MTPAAPPYVLLLGLLFASTLLVSRFSLGQFSPTTYTWLRLAISAAAFAAVYLVGAWRARPRLPAGRALWRDANLQRNIGTPEPKVAILSAVETVSAKIQSTLGREIEEVRSTIEQWILDRWEAAGGSWSKSDAQAARVFIQATYPWMGERNVAHTISQGTYYAWHG